MVDRPGFIDLSSSHLDSYLVPPQLSPRVYYNDGEIPPSMSPLDAFAAQSRMLAKELDMKNNADKRMSRLPPAMVTKSLSQHRADRPSVFRSLSQESSGSTRLEGTGNSPTMATSHERHLSEHPRISGLPSNIFDPEERDHETPVDHSRTSTNTTQIRTSLDYFGLPRTDSPAPSVATADSTTGHIALHNTHNTASKPSRQQPLSRNDSAKSQQLDPMSAFSPPRFVPRQESSDDDYTSSVAGSSFSFPRKLSSSSGVSVPYSPLSSCQPFHPPRSPSIASEASANAIHAPRAPWNFSRPRSTASLSQASRPQSPALSASNTTTQPNSVERKVSAPVKMTNRQPPVQDGYLSGGGASYTYAKFTLPKDQEVSRNSMVFSGLSAPTFEWQGPIFANESLPVPKAPSERPKTAPSSNRRQTLDPGRDPFVGKDGDFLTTIRSASFDTNKRDFKTPGPPPAMPTFFPTLTPPTRPPTSPLPSRPAPPVPSTPKIRATEASASPPQNADPEDNKSLSGTSASTVRPISLKHTPSSASSHYLTPDEHVTKGIECHESGSLQESTYHLRTAAMQNHPTAMLLYALACRHGWGMRPNQREGVQWLRKALDSAMAEVREDETEGSRDTHDRKTRRAQFALSIFELGVSHLNGWGIEQDKCLALRCFEVAAHWGDSDAMTEAGRCYVEGIGCKKDMHLAAKYYRMAEAKGVSMVGNSWIYKDKYNEPSTSVQTSRGRSTRATTITSHPSEKKTRDKSRTRSIFGRKKSERSPPLPLPL